MDNDTLEILLEDKLHIVISTVIYIYHGRYDNVKFVFKKNFKRVIIHKYERYKFKEKRMLYSKQQEKTDRGLT